MIADPTTEDTDMSNSVIPFLLKRRSVVAKKMLPDAPTEEDLQNIINCGLRVPDHSNVQPWKIVVIKGEARKKFDEQIILKAALAKTDEPLSDVQRELESNRMQRSGVVVTVICSICLLYTSPSPRDS